MGFEGKEAPSGWGEIDEAKGNMGGPYEDSKGSQIRTILSLLPPN